MSVNITPSFKFRNITNYIVEPVGEPAITQPANYSIDFSPQKSCLDEAPDDGKQYGRQNKTWTEVPEVPTKTSDLTNDSGFITEETDPVYSFEKSTLALKTDLTKESLTGLKITDNPEFADELITGLKSDANGGDISAEIYTWFKGVYSSLVDGSVISWIKGLVNQVKLLTNRVGLLENNYILKYVAPIDTTEINLNIDRYGNAFNFVEGDVLDIYLRVLPFVGLGSNRVNLQINNITSNDYIWASIILPSFAFAGSVYYGHSGRMSLWIDNGYVAGELSGEMFVTASTYATQNYAFFLRVPVGAITSLRLFVANTNFPIPAGTTILIKKR